MLTSISVKTEASAYAITLSELTRFLRLDPEIIASAANVASSGQDQLELNAGHGLSPKETILVNDQAVVISSISTNTLTLADDLLEAVAQNQKVYYHPDYPDLLKAIKGAEIEVGNHLNRSLQARTLVAAYTCFEDVLELFNPPILTVESVKYYDEDGTLTTMSASNYTVDILNEPGRLTFDEIPTIKEGTPISVEYTAGYTSIPVPIKNALVRVAASLYNDCLECVKGDILRSKIHHYRVL